MEVDQLLDSIAVCEEGISNLPTESLESMLHSLQVSQTIRRQFIEYFKFHLNTIAAHFGEFKTTRRRYRYFDHEIGCN